MRLDRAIQLDGRDPRMPRQFFESFARDISGEAALVFEEVSRLEIARFENTDDFVLPVADRALPRAKFWTPVNSRFLQNRKTDSSGSRWTLDSLRTTGFISIIRQRILSANA